MLRNWAHIVRTLALFGALAHFTSVLASAQIGCPYADVRIPLRVPAEVDAVRFSDLGFAAWNGLDASFLLENRGAKEIVDITVVLAFQTKNADYTQPVVFEAAPDTKQPSDYLIPAERVEPLPDPILPGRKKWISGTSPYTPPECPTSAQVTMLHVHFGDGSDLRWESSDWWTEPLLYDYPMYLSIPDGKAWTADEYFFIGRINREGQLDYIRPFPETVEVPSETVAEALRRLTFSPGLVKGKQPYVANLILIVKFIRPTTAKTVSKQTVREPVKQSKTAVFISLDSPRDSSETDWRFDFGRGFGYTTTVTHHEH